MAEQKNPIKIELLNKDEYKISFNLDNWQISKIVTEKALEELQEQINNATGLTKIAETFNCTGEESRKIKDFWNARGNWPLCNNCKFKWIECYDCVIKCESPLERELFLELRKSNLKPILQRRFNKDGSYYEFPESLGFDYLLTIPDFYFEENVVKLCVYTDGHTFHEKNPKQVERDNNINRELQRLGFRVLRYSGLEIRKGCVKIVEDIKLHLK